MKVQSHFYTLWSYLSIEQARWLAPSVFLSRYKRFLLDVTTKLEHPSEDSLQEKSGYQIAVAEYATNIRGASTDQLPRQKRFDAFVSVLHGVEAAVDEGQ
jgi:hypothetical protein